jgi:branched-subunit amino acid transport protein AzlD
MHEISICKLVSVKEKAMKKTVLVVLFIIIGFFSGCRSNHPSSIIIDPEFNPNNITRILVTPVVSSISDGDDRHRMSEQTTQRVLWEHLSRMSDYVLISPQSFSFALVKANKTNEVKKFKNDWIEGKGADPELLKSLDKYLDIDVILIPEIYLWHKDEADYREYGASSVTQVGMRISLVSPLSGKILWEATDQNYLESLRTEGKRVLVQGAGGYDKRIEGISETGRDIYSAPPFENVLVKVVGAIMTAFPSRSMVRK